MNSVNCVMIVDDNEADQYLAKLSIEEHDPDITVLQAYDGQEALEVLSKVPTLPDLIFLDINMPRMNGHEFLEAYGKTDPHDSSVIIMLTSSSQEKDRKQVERYDFVKNYVVKPLEHTIVGDLA